MNEEAKTIPHMLAEFHGEMEQPFGPTHVPSDDVLAFRQMILQSEVDELAAASGERDLVEIADGLGDIAYVLFGTAHLCGIDLLAVVEEIHRSNMTKTFAGEGGHFKPTKGTGYERPNLAKVLDARKV